MPDFEGLVFFPIDTATLRHHRTQLGHNAVRVLALNFSFDCGCLLEHHYPCSSSPGVLSTRLDLSTRRGFDVSGDRRLAALGEQIVERLGHDCLQRGVLLQRDHMELARYFRREPAGDLTATDFDRRARPQACIVSLWLSLRGACRPYRVPLKLPPPSSWRASLSKNAASDQAERLSAAPA